MKNYYYNGHDSIILSTRRSIREKSADRIKNDLLWDINTYLNKRFELYDFSESIRPQWVNSYVKAIPMNDFGDKKLYIFNLDKIFINRVVIDEDEIRQQHDIIDPKMDYEYFKEWYAVETVDIEYFAVKSLQEFELGFQKYNKGASRKKIIQTIKLIADVYVSMYDSCNMELHFNDNNVKDDILSIVMAHCIQTNERYS